MEEWPCLTEIRRLYRSSDDKMIAGVAGGLAEYFEVDSTLVRVAFFLALLFTTGPFGLVIYAVLAIIIPKEPARF